MKRTGGATVAALSGMASLRALAAFSSPSAGKLLVSEAVTITIGGYADAATAKAQWDAKCAGKTLDSWGPPNFQNRPLGVTVSVVPRYETDDNNWVAANPNPTVVPSAAANALPDSTYVTTYVQNGSTYAKLVVTYTYWQR
jgi:hypothetical protein